MLQLAYLDPVTGTIIIQAIMGSVLAALLTIKIWFNRVKQFVFGLFGRKRVADDDSAD